MLVDTTTHKARMLTRNKKLNWLDRLAIRYVHRLLVDRQTHRNTWTAAIEPMPGSKVGGTLLSSWTNAAVFELLVGDRTLEQQTKITLTRKQ